MTQRLTLNEIVNPTEARIEEIRDTDQKVLQARLDLAQLPRIESVLIGRPVSEVPPLVERLCGVCPVAHHLAGVQALESLLGVSTLADTARQQRKLLQYGSVTEIHATRYFAAKREDALLLRKFGKAGMAAAGSGAHFPTTAVVGGVASGLNAEIKDQCLELQPGAVTAALRIAEQELRTPGQFKDFAGIDLALVDDAGSLDLCGGLLRAISAAGDVILVGEPTESWDELVTEEIPGDSAPRPYLNILGPANGHYRVGPVAQLRMGVLPTPLAAQLQNQWLLTSGSAAAARAIMLLHCVEVIGQLLETVPDSPTELVVDIPKNSTAGIGIGWVDGARGLLVHRYQTSAEGILTDATILTPTAQNEYWLSGLLLEAANKPVCNEELRKLAFEDAIKEADPCLPCVAATPGSMGLVVQSRLRGE